MKVDYSKTFIYKLCCNDINIKDIYVGHSTDYKSRNQDHKKHCNNPSSKEYNNYKYQFIRDNGGYENWKMIKLYDFPCNSKREAEAEEDKTMRELGATLNKQREYITKEEKKEYNKTYSKEYKEKRKNDPEYIKWKKEYEEKRRNKPERIEYKKNYCIEYYQNHKNELKQKVKCLYCNTELNKSSLKRHQKTMKCLKFQECMIIDDE